MRPVPAHWHTETWICSIRGHVAPAADARTLRPEDRRLGVEVADGVRFVRCLRCDTWLERDDPTEPVYETVPSLDELDLPRRGKPLWDAVTLRIIALDKAVHAVLFSLAVVVLIGVQVELGGIRRWAQGLVDLLSTGVGDHVVLGRWLDRLARLDRHEIRVTLAFVTVYAVLEATEAWALWTERRWGEYLTVAATAGFLPLELIELTHSVTPTKVVALAINLAIVVWLILAKHLFGVRGGEAALHDSVDWATILASPTPAGSRGTSRRG